MRHWNNLSAIPFLVTAIALFPASRSVLAQSLAHYQQVEQNTATQTAIDVPLYPGRTTTIDFSQTQEVIRYVGLGNASRVVFNTDAQLNSGQAKTIFLRAIQPLTFPGATTSSQTNLVLKTTNPQGKQRLYHFQIVPKTGTQTRLGVQIIPDNLLNGINISLEDVNVGLQIAIDRGYTPANDPVVLAVQRFLAIAHTQQMPLDEAATAAGIEPAVIIELAKIATEVKDKL